MKLIVKSISMLLITVMMISSLPFINVWTDLGLGVEAADVATEYALFPMDEIKISRTNTKLDADQVGVAASNGGHVWYAWDLAGGDTTVVAPFTGKIIYVDSGGNHSIIMESVNKVKLANGTEDYVVCMFTHDDKLNSNVKVGNVIKQGEYFYDQGTYGNGKTGTYDRHLHFEAAVGKMTSSNKSSFSNILSYMRSSKGRQVYEIFHLTPTTKRTKDYVKVVCQNNKIIKFDWKNVCYLTFNVNGGTTLSKGIFLQNSTVNLGGYTTTKTRCEFAGWHTDEALTTKVTSLKMSNHATVYAKWEVLEYLLKLNYNYTGKNYFTNSDFLTLDTTLYKTRDASVYTLSVAEGRGNGYGALKIVGSTAGSPGKDMFWTTSTMGNVINDGYVGDNKAMILSFWAKSSVAGANLKIRYGYQSTTDCTSIALTTDWKYYTVRVDKVPGYGANFHPYFDKAGTFYISELQLEDGTEATEFVPEKMGYEATTISVNGTYANLPVPEREGYCFDGWYTAVSGGEKITGSTELKDGGLCLYAHWTKHVEEELPAVKATCTSTGLTGGKQCTVCGEILVPQQTIPQLGNGHVYTNSGDRDCNVCGFVRDVKYVGWTLLNGHWYYFKNYTALVNCWMKDSKGWVYLGADGAMLTNAWCRDSKGWCYVGADGYALTNCWAKDSIGWIWLDSEGSMTKSKWIKDNGSWYYLDANGYMVSNCWKKDSKGWVYLGSSGAMLTNAWCRDSKGWCYVGADGYALTNCWAKDSIGWIWLDSEGSMTKNKWIQYNGAWYYLNANGYWVS